MQHELSPDLTQLDYFLLWLLRDVARISLKFASLRHQSPRSYCEYRTIRHRKLPISAATTYTFAVPMPSNERKYRQSYTGRTYIIIVWSKDGRALIRFRPSAPSVTQSCRTSRSKYVT
jgi:hypothetical protein